MASGQALCRTPRAERGHGNGTPNTTPRKPDPRLHEPPRRQTTSVAGRRLSIAMRPVSAHGPSHARSAFVLAAFLAGALQIGLAGPATAESRRDRLETLRSINERWEGAECALRVPFEFKKKRPDDGWYESTFYAAQRQVEGIKLLQFRLKLRDLRPLADRMAARHLVAGTRFRCEGWKFRDADGYDHAFLSLRSVLGDVEGELWLWAGSSHPELKQVERIEQYLRLSILEVRAASETLQRVAVAPARPAALPAPAISAEPFAPTSAASATATAVFRPRVEILAVAVDPPQVAPGTRVDLVVHYSVDGLPPGASFEVVETRTLLRGQASLTETAEPVARTNGTYTSSQQAPVPADAPRGVYRLEVVLRLAGAEAAGAALFEVR